MACRAGGRLLDARDERHELYKNYSCLVGAFLTIIKRRSAALHESKDFIILPIYLT